MSDRAEFEGIYKSIFKGHHMDRDPSGDYVNIAADAAWRVWQARAQGITVPMKPIAESKVRQLGGDVCGVLVRTQASEVMAVSEHGRCTRLDAGVMGPVETEARESLFSERDLFLMKEAMNAGQYYESLEDWLGEVISDGGHTVEQHLAHDADQKQAARAQGGQDLAMACAYCGGAEKVPAQQGSVPSILEGWIILQSNGSILGRDFASIQNTPQPQGQQGSVPEGLTYRWVLNNTKLHNNCWTPHGMQRYVDGWNDCRHAMLCRTTPQTAQQGSVPESIATDDDVERVAKMAGWNNRKYMTPPDYAEWCRRMREFVRLSTTPQPEDGCEWHGDGNGCWVSKCGKEWYFEDGGPEDNGMNYCVKCGKPCIVIGSSGDGDENYDSAM